MKEIINISPNGIKQAIDDLVNENETLQDKVYKLEEQLQQKNKIIKEVREYIEEKEKDDDNWIDYELCIEPVVIKEILDKVGDIK